MTPYPKIKGLKLYFLVFLLTFVLMIILPLPVSASTPPQYPQVSVSIANRTITSGSAIDLSVEWLRNAAVFTSPDYIEVSLFNVSNGNLMAMYSIPLTEEQDSGSRRFFNNSIPGMILPAGDMILTAMDPLSGAEGRVEVQVISSGEAYQNYRDRQVADGIFYPVSIGLIIALFAVLAILVGRKE